MLLIHLLMNSGSVECTSWDFFLRLFRSYVYCHFIFPKMNKSGRGRKIFQKINKRGDYSVLESMQLNLFVKARKMDSVVFLRKQRTATCQAI